MTRIRPAPRLLQDPPLQLDALGPDLLEAGGDDDRPADPGLDALADQVRHARPPASR